MTEDYSSHLIAARKALATAEAQAALHNWGKAGEAFLDASKASNTAAAILLQVYRDSTK